MTFNTLKQYNGRVGGKALLSKTVLEKSTYVPQWNIVSIVRNVTVFAAEQRNIIFIIDEYGRIRGSWTCIHLRYRRHLYWYTGRHINRGGKTIRLPSK